MRQYLVRARAAVAGAAWPALILVALAASAWQAAAAEPPELLMFRRAGCPWCAQWDREIGSVYAKTEIGQRLPVRMIDLDRGSDRKYFLASPVRYTPTFVIAADRREIVRLEGYPGEDFFWGFLDSHFKRLHSEMRNGLSVPAPLPKRGRPDPK